MGAELRVNILHTSFSMRDEKPLTTTFPVCTISLAQSSVGSTATGDTRLGARNATISRSSNAIFPKNSMFIIY